MLQLGIIRPFFNSWSSPLYMVPTHVPAVQENAQKLLQTCIVSKHYHLYTTLADSWKPVHLSELE